MVDQGAINIVRKLRGDDQVIIAIVVSLLLIIVFSKYDELHMTSEWMLDQSNRQGFKFSDYMITDSAVHRRLPELVKELEELRDELVAVSETFEPKITTISFTAINEYEN